MDDCHITAQLPATVLADRLALRIPSRPEWVSPTVDLLRQRALQVGVCAETRLGKLTVALHEALTNAIVHGNLEISSELKEQGDNAFAEVLAERCQDPTYSGRCVTVEVEYDGERCRWAITDEGRGFDVERYSRTGPPDDPEIWLSSGRGILLMRSFVDEVRYEQGGRRVLLTLRRTHGAERRTHARQQLNEPIRVAPLRADGTVDWQAAYQAVAWNFSAGGVGVLQTQLVGSERVLLGVESGGQTLFVPAQVRHCRAVGEGIVELGCQFELEPAPPRPRSPGQEALDKAILRLLGHSQQLIAPEQERRAHPRENYTCRIEVLAETERPAVTGYARDLSRGGIAFMTSVPLRLEPRILSLPQGVHPPLLVLAQIVRCDEVVAGFHDVGARFLALEPDPSS